MITSNDEKRRFIYEYYKEKGGVGEKELKAIQSIPLMIRNNGLFNTIVYLETKEENAIKIFKTFYKKKLGKENLVNDVFKKYKERDKEYLKYTQEFFLFACYLRLYIKAIDKKIKDKKEKKNILNKDIKEWMKGNRKNRCENFNLLFNKEIQYEIKKGNLKPNNLINNPKGIQYYNNISEYLLKKVITVENGLSSYGYKKIDYDFIRELNNQMIIGLGESSVREISIKLDHIYGIPYIPASTIKGAYRNYMEKQYIFEILEKEKKEYSCLINRIFGTEDNEGKLIFMDTYPEKDFEITNDIMNSHYKEYYSGKKPPTDGQNKNPIFFITIEKAKFKFNLFIKKEFYNEKIELIKKSFNKFLSTQALGAKKAVGYGYFKKEGSNTDGKQNL